MLLTVITLPTACLTLYFKGIKSFEISVNFTNLHPRSHEVSDHVPSYEICVLFISDTSLNFGLQWKVTDRIKPLPTEKGKFKQVPTI